MSQAFFDQIGLTGWQALFMVAEATVIFWIFSAFVHLFFAKLNARVSVFSVAVLAVAGSVAARSMLGGHPTMAAGILVLSVIFFWEFVTAVFRKKFANFGRRASVILVRDGHVREDTLAQNGLTRAELVVRLRRKGVTRLRDVDIAILEGNGQLTVIKSGAKIDREFLDDLRER